MHCRANRIVVAVVVVRVVGIGVAIDAGATTSSVSIALTTDAVVCQNAPEGCAGVPPAVVVVGAAAGVRGTLVVVTAQVVSDF